MDALRRDVKDEQDVEINLNSEYQPRAPQGAAVVGTGVETELDPGSTKAEMRQQVLVTAADNTTGKETGFARIPGMEQDNEIHAQETAIDKMPATSIDIGRQIGVTSSPQGLAGSSNYVWPSASGEATPSPSTASANREN